MRILVLSNILNMDTSYLDFVMYRYAKVRKLWHNSIGLVILTVYMGIFDNKDPNFCLKNGPALG